jgi:hypothetical protein
LRVPRSCTTQPGVGHYGIFNGSRYRQEIVPRVVAFMADHDIRGGALRWLWHRLVGERDVAAAPIPLPAEKRKRRRRNLEQAALPVRLSALPANRAIRMRKGRSLTRRSAPEPQAIQLQNRNPLK